jgi:hypothetical protein
VGLLASTTRAAVGEIDPGAIFPPPIVAIPAYMNFLGVFDV